MLLPVEQVDEVVVVVPQVCRHCEQRLPESAAHRRSPGWRHQVVELLPLAVRVAGASASLAVDRADRYNHGVPD